MNISKADGEYIIELSQSEYNNFEKEIRDMYEELVKLRQENTKLMLDQTAAYCKIDALTRANNDLLDENKELFKLRHENKILKFKINSIYGATPPLMPASLIEEVNEKVVKENKELKEENEKLKKDNEELKKEHQRLNERIEELEYKVDDWKRQYYTERALFRDEERICKELLNKLNAIEDIIEGE